MIYGLYLSATGVLANSYRQDVIANNLANSETVGFKRDLAICRERLTETKARGLNPGQASDPSLEPLGGGFGVAPTATDMSQGDLESTGNPLDAGIMGQGFFAVRQRGQIRLTRDGRFFANRDGNLAMVGTGAEVLDAKLRPIALAPGKAVAINVDGTISQNEQPVGRIGLFDVADQRQLRKQGDGLLAFPGPAKSLRPASGAINNNFVERANVEPSTELTQLLDAQRQLEANANMIRYQDQTLGRLVNDVGKIG